MDHPKLEEWKTVWRERRSVTMVYILLRISVVLVMLAQIFNGNLKRFSLRADTYPVHDAQRPGKKLDITLPNTLEIIILLFIYAAEIMGEIGAYYVTFPYWDHGAAHAERLFVRGHRVLAAGHSEPPQRGAVPPVAAVSGHRGVLLLDDRRRHLGIF